ncbi:uncharacterized protein LOC121774857 [Salvia splendens]|uniref:uncharacterized protein LOC121774857 n=1 Tax=Salvia splendens TaxID=180675 RepID=UPI001C2716E0|nr:uncharacterized protein LOC121774857 [Salvia splendens]
MEGMREIARSFYERASEDEQKSIQQFFAEIDVDGDGKISFREFKKAVGSWLCREAVFEKLDKNGDGCLDFEEFLCLYYMEKKVDISECGGCSDLLVGPYFSCILCQGKGASTYDLCCACYRSGAGPWHEHDVQHVMDHHSLLMHFRNGSAEFKREMKELRDIARAHYDAGSPQVQALASNFFRSMDSDRDGRVNLSEFLAFMSHEGYPYMQNSCFFDMLDVDCNGTLDFYEVMTLYYIIKSGRPFCNCCNKFIPGTFFSCVECFKNPRNSYYLCLACYRTGRCHHSHDGRTQFLDNHTLLQAVRGPALAHASVVPFHEAWNRPTHGIAPLQHVNVYNSYMNQYNTYINHQNAIVPASSNSNWSNWKYALTALEGGLSIGGIASTLCTIL